MISGTWTTATVAKSGTTSSEVDLGREYENLQVYIPTIDTAQVNIQVSEKSGGTFADLYATDLTDGSNSKLITASGTGGFHWTVPIGGFQYIKIKCSAAQSTAARTFRVCGTRS